MKPTHGTCDTLAAEGQACSGWSTKCAEVSALKAQLTQPDAATVKDAQRYRHLKTLSGQVLFIHIIRNKGADFLDAAVDKEMEDQP
jgi:hypothetical protein